MASPIAGPTLRGVGDVLRRLSQRVNPDELDAMFGDNGENFSLLVVAEAVLPRVPLGIVTWLRQPHNSAEWAEVLIENEGLHQIAWWQRKVRYGETAEETQRARETLTAIRARLPEARQVAGVHAKPRSQAKPEARALERLREAHRDEYEQMTKALRRQHGLPLEAPRTVTVDRLLELSDIAFRNVVARDVRNDTRVNDLAHPSVTSRWHEALVELGMLALEALGLPTEKIDRTADEARFAIADARLPVGPLRNDEIAAWIARLTFLTHVRVRLMERARHRQVAKKRATDKVHAPIEAHLRSVYFAEYARYRIEEQNDPAPAAPSRVDVLAASSGLQDKQEMLRNLGWHVEAISDGGRIWLDARKGVHRLVAAASRSGHGRGRAGWKPSTYFAYAESADAWHRLPSFEAMNQLAQADPHLFESQVELVEPRHLITGAEQLRRIVPPVIECASQQSEASR